MKIIEIKTKLYNKEIPIIDFIIKNIISEKPTEGDIIVVTSKIIALSENRIGKIRDKKLLIKKESLKISDTPWASLTLTNEGWTINAGIDESNANNCLILLPKDPFISAEKLRKGIMKYFKLKKLGILITDTRSTPLRVGTVGKALGYAGFLPLKSYIGKPDIYGRKSRITVSNIADSLASAAVLMMGEGDEMIPITIIRGSPVKFTAKPLPRKMKRLFFSPQKDIFSKVFIQNEL